MESLGSKMEAAGNKMGTKVKNIFHLGKTGSTAGDVSFDSTGQPSYVNMDSNLISTQSSMSTIVASQQQNLDWLTGDFYLNIVVREGRNLAHTDGLESSDPFVRVTFGDEGGRMEDQTRVCYHNSDPLWEESLLFPLQSKPVDTRISVAVYGRVDVKKPKFMGHVVFHLGFILSSIKEVNEEVVHWCPLTRKKSTDNVSGDICFAVSVVSAARYLQLHNEMTGLLEPAQLHSRLGSMMLALALNDVKRLQASCEKMGPLSLEVRIGRSLVKKSIVFQEVVDPANGKSTVATLGDVILIPLARAFKKQVGLGAEERAAPTAAAAFKTSLYGFQGMMNKMAQDVVDGATLIGKPLRPSKEKNEIADIKIYVKAGRDIIAKTQIPIWTVPTKAEESLATASAPPDSSASSTPLSPSASTTPTVSAALDKAATIKGLTEPVAAPPTAPAPQGRRFARVMESYRKDLMAPYIRLEMAVTLQLRPKEGAAVAAVETVEDSDLDEEDIAAPPAYSPPADLDTFVAETTFDCGPNKLYRILWRPDGDVLKKLADIEKLKDMVVGPFIADPVTKTKSRATTYIKPLNLNIPFVPKEAPCVTLMTVQSKEDGGWCVTQKVETKAPQGDAFYVLMQWVAVHQSASKTRVKVTMHIEFLRNVMTKNIIISQSVASSKKSAEVIIGLVREQVGGAGAEASTSPAAVGAAAAASAAAEASTGVFGLPLSMAQLLDLLKFFVLLLVLWNLSASITRGSNKVFSALERVVEALRAQPASAGVVRSVLAYPGAGAPTSGQAEL